MRYGFGMENDPNPDRVKDPLGHYEELRAKSGPDTTWAGPKLLILIPLIVVGVGLGLWGFVSAIRGLFGG